MRRSQQTHKVLSVNHITTPDKLDFDKIDYAGFAAELIGHYFFQLKIIILNMLGGRFASYILHFNLKVYF